VDLSLNMVLLVLVLGFVTLHAALRALDAMLSLPRQAHRWRLQQRERSMHAALLDAFAQMLAGRFLRARKAALAALDQEQALRQEGETPPHGHQIRALAHMVAAETSHALQDRALRDHYFELALNHAKEKRHVAQELHEGAHMRAARWSLDDRDADASLERLAQLPLGAARRTLALRIRLKASRLAGRTRDALDTARLLGKHRAFSADAARSLVRGLAIELIQQAHDPAQLQAAWLSLDASDRAMPEVALQAAHRLALLEGDNAQVRQWLQPVWQQFVDLPSSLNEVQAQRLVSTLEASLDGTDAAWLARIESAQQANPRNARLQYLAGMACAQRQLWGKAQQLLAQAAPQLQDARLRRNAWSKLAELAEQRNDTTAAALAWKNAAQAV
jgi:HemY protein